MTKDPPELLSAQAGPVAPAVVDELIKSYYPAVVASADAARQRAQNAYAIASAVAAALVAAGIFGGIGDAARETQAVGVAALVGWLAAAACFIYAVGGSVQPRISGEQPDADHFVRAALTNVRCEREAVTDRLNAAQSLTVAAIVLTLATVALALFDQVAPEKKTARVSLTKAGTAAVAPVCGKASVLTGKLDPGDLSKTYVPLAVTKPPCGGKGVVLRLRKADVASVAFSAS